MTPFRPHATQATVGRKKQFDERFTLTLTRGMRERIDRALNSERGEARTDFVRDAIERELRRRHRTKAGPPPKQEI